MSLRINKIHSIIIIVICLTIAVFSLISVYGNHMSSKKSISPDDLSRISNEIKQPSVKIPDGYGEVKFGMSKDEAKTALQLESKKVHESGNLFAVYGDKLFDERIDILYSFSPLTQKCTRITINFPFPSEYDPEKLYMRIGDILTKKYGNFEYTTQDDMTIWNLKNINIILFLGRDGKVSLAYSDKNLENSSEEEQRRIDREVDKENEHKL